MSRTLALLAVCTLLWGCQSTPTRDDDARDPVTVPRAGHFEAETDVVTGAAPIEAIVRDVKRNGGTWHGTPPVGTFSPAEVKHLYRYSKYETDLGMMSMRFEHPTEKTRNETANVPYGFCLDFIDQNLGKQNEEGWHLTRITCTQSGLGKDY